MTLEEAKNLKQGQIIYAVTDAPVFNRKGLNADGSKMRYKVTSVKTWKTRPDEVLVKVKHGLYEYAKINEKEIQHFLINETVKENELQ